MFSLTLATALAAPATEGTWVLVSTETDGKPVAREKLSELKVVIGNGRLEYVYAGEEPNLVYQLELDPSASPKQFTLTQPSGLKASAVPGIYELDGDTLRLCFADGEGRETRRPKEFATAPGTRQVLLTLKREKRPK